MPKKEATARIKINRLLEAAGWRFFSEGRAPANIYLEQSITTKLPDLDTLGNNFEKTSKGFIDFLLLDTTGFPLIVLEAKSEDKNPRIGKEQARRYAHVIESKQFTDLATNPVFSTRDFRAVPEKYRFLIPEYVNDCVSLTMFVNMDERRVIQVEEGKGADTVEQFAHAFREHNGDTEAVKNMCCDMSPSFIAGVEKHMPEAAITLDLRSCFATDRYHVMKVLNDAVDKVRRQEAKEQEILKKTRYLWLTNRPNLSDKQSTRLKGILPMTKLKSQTVKAYHIRKNFQLFYEITDPQVTEAYLQSWFWRATQAGGPAAEKFAWEACGGTADREAGE